MRTEKTLENLEPSSQVPVVVVVVERLRDTMPQRRGQRRNRRGKQPKSTPAAAKDEPNPLSLLGGDSAPLPTALPGHTAAVPGLAEWYLPYKRNADHSLTESDEQLVLEHGVDAPFDDRTVSLRILTLLVLRSSR